jgi:long-chain acyl-CoA synthetase
MSEDLWTFVSKTLVSHARGHAWVCRLLGGKRRVYTYQDIYTAALDLAARMRQRGIGVGDVVGVYAPNGPEWGVAALAVWKLGAVLGPIHTGFSDDELGALIKALNPVLILTHGVDRRVAGAVDIHLEADTGRARAEAALVPPVGPDDEAVRSYTSGSTGQPKLVRLSHRNIVSNVKASTTRTGPTINDRFLSLLPLSHMMELTGGMLLPLSCGATIVLPRVLAAHEILEALAAENITVVIAVPRLYRNMMLGLEKQLATKGRWLRVYRAVLARLPIPLRRRLNWPIRRKLGGRIRAWISGGSRLDPAIMAYFRALGLPLRQGYGLTETSPVLSLQHDFEPSLDSVGPPLDGVEVRIHEPDAQGSGELWVRGESVMLGYVDPAQTREAMSDGWFKTGDLARLDEQGRIILTGRSKRLIVTEAGKNVYPEELETLLERIPDVKEAAVLEVGMRPAVVLAVTGEHQAAKARQIIKRFNSRVSPHNRITRFALVDELPRTPLGKVALSKLPDVFAQKEMT